MVPAGEDLVPCVCVENLYSRSPKDETQDAQNEARPCLPESAVELTSIHWEAPNGENRCSETMLAHPVEWSGFVEGGVHCLDLVEEVGGCTSHSSSTAEVKCGLLNEAQTSAEAWLEGLDKLRMLFATAEVVDVVLWVEMGRLVEHEEQVCILAPVLDQ